MPISDIDGLMIVFSESNEGYNVSAVTAVAYNLRTLTNAGAGRRRYLG
jgi:hypothetical protein